MLGGAECFFQQQYVCSKGCLPNFLDATGSCFRWCLASVFFGISRCMWNEAFLLQGAINLAVQIFDDFGRMKEMRFV